MIPCMSCVTCSYVATYSIHAFTQETKEGIHRLLKEAKEKQANSSEQGGPHDL